MPRCAGNECGLVSVSLQPSDAAGLPLHEDEFVDEPSKLLGHEYHFWVHVRSVTLYNVKCAPPPLPHPPHQ